MIRRPPRSPLFPYTTLSRSCARKQSDRTLVGIGSDNQRVVRARVVDAETVRRFRGAAPATANPQVAFKSERRSEEHTSELQSQSNLVCRLLLEKKNTTHTTP